MFTLENIMLLGQPVAYWGYGKAYVTKQLMVWERDDQTDEVHRQLASHFKYALDNKSTFMINTMDGDDNVEYYVMFKDNRMILGLGIRPYYGTELAAPQMPNK